MFENISIPDRVVSELLQVYNTFCEGKQKVTSVKRSEFVEQFCRDHNCSVDQYGNLIFKNTFHCLFVQRVVDIRKSSKPVEKKFLFNGYTTRKECLEIDLNSCTVSDTNMHYHLRSISVECCDEMKNLNRGDLIMAIGDVRAMATTRNCIEFRECEPFTFTVKKADFD